MKEYFDHYYMEEHMKISHFRNHYEVSTLRMLFCTTHSLCDFFPMTYELPTEYHMFVEEFKKNPGQIWIMKPVAKSQGKGIFLFRKLKDIVDWKKGEYNAQPDPNKEAPETYVVQRYIDDPYLIGGRKFDLRVYVLVTTKTINFNCLRSSLTSLLDVHLTNVAVQKTAPDYDPEKGSKWSLQQLRKYLTAKHGLEQVKKCFQLMDDIFVHTLLSVQKIMINDKHCFELYGYDILLDSNLKPYLIEVNASPSLTASSTEDYDLKYGLLEDVLHVIDLENRLTGKEHRIGGFDLFWDDGPVYADEGGLDYGNTSTTPYNSYLDEIDDEEIALTDAPKK
ncbi:hypothetical protein LSH36_37g03006 [Paralvinella palmiformis]|uniref:Tubulin--tyrosine ligase-like protein 9 n=1 Tax=Paralvinella palmiformis TaxID=53620 RepID=A0AAD9K8F7_9ANNE|nr:hypothetical protein LSH36_37g03006 [Paralvinella palmiformis]